MRQIVLIHSTAMQKNFRATICLPADYIHSKRSYPVVYLLHGFSGDYSTWSKLVSLDVYADKFKCIIVCPDGGYSSWYIDSPLKKDSKFETYITKEVIPFVDYNFRTIAKADGRAIIGSSMGGHGALILLARHPDLFAAAGSISGIMEIASFPTQWDLPKILGQFSGNELTWYQNSFIGQIDKLKKMKKSIILDCGTDDFALIGNRKAHEKLLANHILHDYIERPGTHSPDYPANALEYHMLYCSRVLEKAKEKP